MKAIMKEFLAAMLEAPRMYFAPLIGAGHALRAEANQQKSHPAH